MFGKRRGMRGQAAIEYLMTYGWALLVIAIVIVALYMILQTQGRTEQCNAPVGFLCNDPMPQVSVKAGGGATAGQNYINFRLYNKQTQSIVLDRILCTTLGPQDADYNKGKDASGAMISSGSFANFTGVDCYGNSNTALRETPGQEFKGYVVIWYHYENDIDPSIKKSMTLSVSTTVAKPAIN
jgi:hypothetical protein